jgi:hypothetical protein
MRAGCIPIYWGNPLIEREFNPRSFINVHAFPNHESAIERVLEIDSDPELHAEYLSEPWCDGNKLNEFYDRQRVLDQFEKIFTTQITPVSQRASWFGRWTFAKKDRA